jgi:signal transduction histidine kinase
VRLRLDLDTSMPYIEADVGRLRQLLNNLVQNALDAMEGQGGGELLLSTRCMEETGCRFFEFAATDTGPGVPQEMLHNLFEPYVTGKIKGTGLGLAIVKKIVEEHGGIVWAENRPQGGARIVIRLPVVRAAADLLNDIAAIPDEGKKS